MDYFLIFMLCLFSIAYIIIFIISSIIIYYNTKKDKQNRMKKESYGPEWEQGWPF